jgi:hypothetical protein
MSRTLTDWQLGDYESVAVLLVSELVANAAVHARTAMAVEMSETGDGLRIAVSDYSPRAPARRRYGLDASTGRGLALVEQLSAGWGVDPLQDGKSVWFLLTAEALGREDTTLAAAFDLADPLEAWSEDTAGHWTGRAWTARLAA